MSPTIYLNIEVIFHISQNWGRLPFCQKIEFVFQFTKHRCFLPFAKKIKSAPICQKNDIWGCPEMKFGLKLGICWQKVGQICKYVDKRGADIQIYPVLSVGWTLSLMELTLPPTKFGLLHKYWRNILNKPKIWNSKYKRYSLNNNKFWLFPKLFVTLTWNNLINVATLSLEDRLDLSYRMVEVWFYNLSSLKQPIVSGDQTQVKTLEVDIKSRKVKYLSSHWSDLINFWKKQLIGTRLKTTWTLYKDDLQCKMTWKLLTVTIGQTTYTSTNWTYLIQIGNLNLRTGRLPQMKDGLKNEFPLVPMGVLAPGSAHTRPSDQAPIDTSGSNFVFTPNLIFREN
jgi:hypothetical protein